MSGLDALRAIRALPRDVGPVDRAMLAILVSYADASGSVYEPPPDPQTGAPPYTLTVATFGRAVGLTDERSARASIARLVGRGYVLATDRPGRTRQLAIAPALWVGGPVADLHPSQGTPLPLNDTPPKGHPSHAALPLPSDATPVAWDPSHAAQLTPPIPCGGPLPSHAGHSVEYLDPDLDGDLEKRERETRASAPPSVRFELKPSEPEKSPKAKSEKSTKPKASTSPTLAAWGEGVSRVTGAPWAPADSRRASGALGTIISTHAPKGQHGESLTGWLADAAERFARGADDFQAKRGFDPSDAIRWFNAGSPTTSPTAPKPNGYARPTSSNQPLTLPADAY